MNNAPIAIEPNTVYRFKKSGNLVRTVEPSGKDKAGDWVVKRVDTGKQMIVPARALIDPNHPDWS
jgi:hypothetical protein